MGISLYTPQLNWGETFLFAVLLHCRTPTEAALLPTKPYKATNVSDYHEQIDVNVVIS